MKKLAIIFLAFLVFSLWNCGSLSDHNEGPIASPDSNLELFAFVNRTDDSNPNFAKVILTVDEKSSGRTTELVTRIGDAMKWAIGWFDNNIIVAQSSDIGTRSWRFANGNFEELSVTPEMHAFAKQLRIEKYNLNE